MRPGDAIQPWPSDIFAKGYAKNAKIPPVAYRATPW